MSKWLMLVFFSFITSNFLLAQNNKFEVKGSVPGIYIEHVVTPKENFYSVGRMFNVSPKELASFNHLHFASGLNIGQVLKIPLDKNNFTQEKSIGANEVLIPIYHTVAPGETLYRLGLNYNKVPLESLKKWNSLTSDAVNVGSPMIVGYLKVDKNQSSLSNSQSTAKQVVPVAPVIEKPVEKKAEVVEAVKPVETIVKPEEKKEMVTQNVPVTQTAVKEGGKFGEGHFKPYYEQQNAENSPQTGSGTAGVFKSTSGWQDGKYYCFNNNAAPGSILKVINNSNGRIIYAKVLDAMPDIKQNSGLVVIVSNAAADELGAGEGRFECVVEYVK